MKTKRIVYLDLLRIISILAVIIIHVTATSDWYNMDSNSTTWQVLNGINQLVRWGVPLFVMISGAIFLNSPKADDIKSLYTKNVFKILICLFSWNLVYHFYVHRIFTLTNLIAGLKATLSGNYYTHLWFLYMILGIYIVIPIIRALIKGMDEKTFKYLIYSWFIFRIVIMYLLSITNSPILNFFDSMRVNLFNDYFVVFILGYYISTINLSKVQEKILYISSISLTILGVIMSNYQSYITLDKFQFNDPLSPSMILLSCAIFYFVKKKLILKEDSKVSNIITNLGVLTFGVYLIHFLVIRIFINMGILLGSEIYVISVIYNTVIVYIASLIIIYIMSKIPLIKKYLI